MFLIFTFNCDGFAHEIISAMSTRKNRRSRETLNEKLNGNRFCVDDDEKFIFPSTLNLHFFAFQNMFLHAFLSCVFFKSHAYFKDSFSTYSYICASSLLLSH